MTLLPWVVALLLPLPQARKESTSYYSDAYAPSYLIRRQPWQAVALDSKGDVVVAHPYDIAAGNKPVGGSRRLDIFSPEGEGLASLRDRHGMTAYGLAIDEKNGKIYAAANAQDVAVFDWAGPGAPLLFLREERRARKDGSRCVGVGLDRHGTLFTADLAENKVFRFYPGGGHSSFGSGPGGGDQGFNDLRRVFPSPVDGSLYTLDRDGIRRFSPAGRFLRRIGPRIADENWILAMGPDGRLLAGWGAELRLLDADGGVLKTLPIDPRKAVDAALGKDGRIAILPRGEEFAYALYDPDGKLLLQRGADFDRLAVTLQTGKSVSAKVEFTNALRAGLLAGAEKKAAEARPQHPAVSAFARAAKGAPWQKLDWSGDGPLTFPDGAQELRFTTAAAEGVGPAVEFALR